MKKMFVEELPHGGKCINKNRINWGNSIGYKVKFIYDSIRGEVEIIDYNSKTHRLYIKYLNNKPCKIHTDTFRKCEIAQVLGLITNEFKIEIGQILRDNKRDLTVIDRKIIKKEVIDKLGRKSISNIKVYKYRCNKCGFECGENYKDGIYEKEYWIAESTLLKEIGCGCCYSKIVVPGINDIPTTAPWMVKYFQDGYNEAKRYSKGSTSKIYPMCPDCGRIKDKPMAIFNIYEQGIGCVCSDGINYPNKFCNSLLTQLNIKFKTEYSPKWIRSKRYDFYFELNNKKYIIEMDGNWHYQDNNLSGQTKEKSKEIDNYKDKLAKEHNIEIIRIDCKKSDLEYIKDKILNSKLNKLFDLSEVNWLKCEEFALSNLVKQACEIKKNNPNMTTKEIGNIMNLQYATIWKYLKQGTKLGWCDYNIEHEKNKRNIKAGKAHGKPIEIFKDGVFLGKFESALELERQSEKLFGVKLNFGNISAVCNHRRKTHKGFTFKFADIDSLEKDDIAS